MGRGATLPVVVELRVGAQPIAGSLRVPGEAASEFQGWLQLTSLLEEAASGTAPSQGNSRAKEMNR